MRGGGGSVPKADAGPCLSLAKTGSLLGTREMTIEEPDGGVAGLESSPYRIFTRAALIVRTQGDLQPGRTGREVGGRARQLNFDAHIKCVGTC